MDDLTKKKIKLFSDDMMNFSADNKVSKWIYQSKIHFILISYIVSNNRKLTFEEICRAINHNISSRSTIQKILDASIQEKLLYTEVDVSDKRKKLFFPTEKCIEFFELWVKRQVIIFNQI